MHTQPCATATPFFSLFLSPSLSCSLACSPSHFSLLSISKDDCSCSPSLYHDTPLPIFLCVSLFLSLGDLLCNSRSLSFSGVTVWVQGTEFMSEDDEEEEELLAVAELWQVLDRAHAAFPTNHSSHRAPSCVSLISKSLAFYSPPSC